MEIISSNSSKHIYSQITDQSAEKVFFLCRAIASAATSFKRKI